MRASARNSGGSAVYRLRKLFVVEDNIKRNVGLALVFLLQAFVESVQTPVVRVLGNLAVPLFGAPSVEPGGEAAKILVR